MQNTTKVLAIVLIVLLALLLLGGFGMMGFGMMGPGMMSRMMGGYGYGFDPFRMVLGLAFWALIMGGITLLVVYFVRNAKSFSLSSELPEKPAAQRLAASQSLARTTSLAIS